MAIIEPSCIDLCNILEHRRRSNNYIKTFNINMIHLLDQLIRSILISNEYDKLSLN